MTRNEADILGTTFCRLRLSISVKKPLTKPTILNLIDPLQTVTRVLPRPRPPPQRPRPAQRTGRLGDVRHDYPGAGVQTDVYTYPATSNKLGAISFGAGGNRAFTYDAAGNVTYDNRAAGGYGYAYNAAGRMSEFTLSGVLKASYKYDFAGRQAIRTLSGGITIHSVFDSSGNRIAEYNEATGALIREYVWFNGAPLAVIEGGVTTFIRADHIGRPVFGTNTGGTKTWTASYLPFGGVRTTTGTPITARFPGQWFQSESGLHQNWMRDYDPTTGRYLQADPLGLVDGASVYGYARQSPSMYSDPTGECPVCLLVIVVAAALLTPDAANAPGYCDEIAPLEEFAPYINGVIAAVTVAPFAAGFPRAAVGSKQTALQVTVHGAERIAGPSATRGGVLTADRAAEVIAKGKTLSQSDGAVVSIIENSGKYDVVVHGQRGVITTLSNISEKSYARLANKYGWK